MSCQTQIDCLLLYRTVYLRILLYALTQQTSLVMEADRDPVSLMQESVDQLALAMFDSLRLIPFAEEVTRAPKPAVHAAEPVPGTPILRAVATDAAWSEKVQSLAQGVLKQASILDDLIDTLPGAELCEEKQMEVTILDVGRSDSDRTSRAPLKCFPLRGMTTLLGIG